MKRRRWNPCISDLTKAKCKRGYIRIALSTENLNYTKKQKKEKEKMLTKVDYAANAADAANAVARKKRIIRNFPFW